MFFNGKRHFLSFKSQPNKGSYDPGLWHWSDPYLMEHPSKEWIDMLKLRKENISKAIERSGVSVSELLLEEYKILNRVVSKVSNDRY